MVGKFLILLAVMLVVFLVLYGIAGIFAAMMAEENRQVCRNCEYYDKAMDCCKVTWKKVNPNDTCKSYTKAKEGKK